MFNNVVLDVFLGLIFIYLLYSFFASIIQEIIATQLAFRAKILEKGILRMLEDGKTTSRSFVFDRIKGLSEMLFRTNRLYNKKFASAFYAHPLIKYLAEDNYFSKPAYLSAQNFSKIIVDLLSGFNADQEAVLAIKGSLASGRMPGLPEGIGKDPDNRANMALQKNNMENSPSAEINPETTIFLKSLWNESNGNIQTFKQKLEEWFDTTMERASGWYKRYTQFILFIIGLLIAVAFNVDSIIIAQKLSSDPKLREQVIQSANAYMEREQEFAAGLSLAEPGSAEEEVISSELDALRERSQELQRQANELLQKDIGNINQIMGLGYGCNHTRLAHIFFFAYSDASLMNFFGWVITALAISLGAPFWFDLLKKIMKVRGTGTKLETPAENTINKTSKPQPITVQVNNQSTEEAVG